MLDFLKIFFLFFSPFFSAYGKDYLSSPLFHNLVRKIMNMYLKVVFIQWEKKESETLTDIYIVNEGFQKFPKINQSSNRMERSLQVMNWYYFIYQSMVATPVHQILL